MSSYGIHHDSFDSGGDAPRGSSSSSGDRIDTDEGVGDHRDMPTNTTTTTYLLLSSTTTSFSYPYCLLIVDLGPPISAPSVVAPYHRSAITPETA